MIITTTQNETALLLILLDSMTIVAERIDAPAGASIFLPETKDCLALYQELDLCSAPLGEL